MVVDIAGEDQVTLNIIKRLIADYRSDITIGETLPARGGQIKKFAPNYNRLESPIFLLTDLDNYECAPSLIRDWLGNTVLSGSMLFRVACDEAESWLMADRNGFARWLAIDIDLIPLPKVKSRRDPTMELPFPCKPSLFMMQNLAPNSGKQHLKDDLIPRNGASKGPAYNSAITPFIEKLWNVENAASNSDSLTRAIKRIKEFNLPE